MLVEDAHGTPGDAPDLDGAGFWGDSRRRVGGVRVAPSMQQFVQGKQEVKNKRDKEKRKAHENRRQVPKGPEGDKGTGKGDGQHGGWSAWRF